MLKLGILDFDTSHVVEFTKRLNHLDVDKEQWVDGATVVLACPGESKLAPEKVAGYTDAIKRLKVDLVESPKDLIGKVDAMLIEAVDGSVHWERAKPFLEAGVPCFVDKPFACSLADAKKMADLAAKKKLPLFSSSALRYAPEVIEYVAAADKRGKLHGVLTYGPASTHERNPGLFHYGIHAVEMLFTLMGPGCETVTSTHQAGVDVATGTWKGGRVGTVRGIRDGKGDFGFVAFADKSVTASAVSAKFIYRELLERVVDTFTTGKPPIDIAETLEIVAFIEAANRSGENHGRLETVKV